MSRSSGEGEPEVGFGASHHHHLPPLQLLQSPTQTQFLLPSKAAEGIFFNREIRGKNENKTVGLVWCKNMKNLRDGNGEKETAKASSDTNLPAAGLGHGSSTFTLPSLQQSE